MTDILLLLTERDFWFFNKESIALALVIALTGFVWAIAHEAGKWVWFYFKNKLKK